jgi:hypothetical protein
MNQCNGIQRLAAAHRLCTSILSLAARATRIYCTSKHVYIHCAFMVLGNDQRVVWQVQEASEESQSQLSLGSVNGHRGEPGVLFLPKAMFMFQDSPRQRHIKHQHVIQPFPSRGLVFLKPSPRTESTGDSPCRFDTAETQYLLLELIALHPERIPDSVTGRLLALLLP